MTPFEVGLGILIVVLGILWTMGMGDNEPEWKQCKICNGYYMKFMEGPNGECPYVHDKSLILEETTK